MVVDHVNRVSTGCRVDTCSNISIQFVEIKCTENDHTLQTVRTKFENNRRSNFSKKVRILVFTTCTI